MEDHNHFSIKIKQIYNNYDNSKIALYPHKKGNTNSIHRFKKYN